MACDPQALANASRCISQCIPEGQQLPALISLFCTIADNGGGGGGGSGTVTSFSAGNLSPLFTTSVANPTTTPALTFSLTAQANNTVFAGPNGGGPLAPTFRALVLADISGLGTGVATALAVNVGTAGAFVVNGGALGTPSSGTLSNCTGLPVGSITGLGANVATWLATPTSANLFAAVATTTTGSGSLVGSVSPTLTGTLTAAIITASGAVTTTVNGALSAPGLKATGTWITGGTSTTCKPYVLIEPAGTTSTAWFTGGTGLGINCAAGFVGYLADIHNNGTQVFSIDYLGGVACRNLTATTADIIVTTGVYQCQGQGGISGTFTILTLTDLTFTGGILTGST